MGTNHAPAERKEFSEIEIESKFIEKHAYLKDVFDAMPEVAAVLNDERQIVYANKSLLEMLPTKNCDDILGSRPGEAVECIHSSENGGGCGTSESCRYCGAVNAILESRASDEKVQKECRIEAIIDDKSVNLDFRVSAAPIVIGDRKFTIMFMHDISAEKRKIALERIFFHDILNTAGCIKGFARILLETEDPETLKEHIKVVDQLSYDLVDEIRAQIALILAENGDLKVINKDIEAPEILQDARNTVSYHIVAEGKNIIMSSPRGSGKLKSDPTLVKRILINLIKNALEASDDNGQVLIGYYNEGNAISFYVHNDQYMTDEVQLQVFKRSFSTKGKDRGLGTYSIKLLTEKYLKGKVWFESDKEKGTTFFARIPA